MIEINNKHYIDVKWYLLDTKERTNMYFSDYGKELNLASNPLTYYQTGKHLYITSSEEIKEGDWFYQEFDNKIHQCYKVTNDYIIAEKPSDYPKSICRKVIATTDISLTINKTNTGVFKDLQYKLPNPSEEYIQSFVEEYNKGSMSNDILVRLEWIGYDGRKGENVFKIKEKYNTITIKQITIKQKEENWESIYELISNQYPDIKLGKVFNTLRSSYNPPTKK